MADYQGVCTCVSHTPVVMVRCRSVCLSVFVVLRVLGELCPQRQLLPLLFTIMRRSRDLLRLRRAIYCLQLQRVFLFFFRGNCRPEWSEVNGMERGGEKKQTSELQINAPNVLCNKTKCTFTGKVGITHTPMSPPFKLFTLFFT